MQTTLRHRRLKLAEIIDFPAILWSGSSSPRNFPANTFPHRANSHFLYFAGIPLENAAIRLESGKLPQFLVLKTRKSVSQKMKFGEIINVGIMSIIPHFK